MQNNNDKYKIVYAADDDIQDLKHKFINNFERFAADYGYLCFNTNINYKNDNYILSSDLINSNCK
jgi:hypothetical protein